ncbi:hypothetical protein MKX03_021128 [Papaver bracteatum]|nr:hypothetical protein MKX03_021128 [Papaver bracteatum]
MGVGEDRLSNLYDPLLHHIFSFLPFKCVVATCILSKRWKDLWISSPVLNIQEWRRYSRSRFLKTTDGNTGQEEEYWSQETTELVNFMDRLLHQSHPLFRNDLPTIKKFCLDYDSTYANHKISGWILTLMMRKIEEISLCIPIEFVVPMGLFTCETLTVLKIEMSGDLSTKMKKIGTLRAAETILFPSLKILHLKHMIFVDESLNGQLFSNSPVLEELMLSNCYMAITKVLHISVASLKRLFITNSKMYSCKLNIYAPNLQSLTYNGTPEGYANTEHVFSSVVDAHIDITFESRTNKNSKRRCGLKNLVEVISNVKILHISGSTLESFFWDEMSEIIPTFHDLRRLDVSSKLSLSMFYALLNLLLKVPNLESVVIAQGFSPSENYRGLDTCGSPRRQECLLQQLKAVQVREIDGKQEDLDMIKYFLRNSPALQIMTITFPSSLPQCRQDSVMKKILMLPKCSTFTACMDGAKGIISLRSIRLLGLQNKNTGVGKDRLSDLHDPLLHHIFSFLPFKCVVATCILSKRWKDLWISSPVLNIKEWRRYSRSRFIETRDDSTGQEDEYWSQETRGLVNFMDRLLHQSHPLFRNDLPNTKKFCLDYDSIVANDKISGWIITLMMRKVEELCLCIPIEFVVPMGLFTCETLTVLKIEMSGDLSMRMKKIGTLRAAEKISFPRLKILHLKHMIFVDESLNAQLFSNSPVLEELMLSNCYMAKTKVLHISVASLKRFFITNSKMFSCKLKIYAPNLQSLTYNGMTEGYANTEHVFSSIVDADIDLTYESRTNKNSKRHFGLKNLVEGISNVTILHVSGSTLESFYWDEMNEIIPTFHDLRRLYVTSKLSGCMFFALLNLLHKMPNLEAVVIAQGFSPSENYHDLDTFRIRECLLRQLKAVEVREIDGKQEDFDMMKYVLRNSCSADNDNRIQNRQSYREDTNASKSPYM